MALRSQNSPSSSRPKFGRGGGGGGRGGARSAVAVSGRGVNAPGAARSAVKRSAAAATEAEAGPEEIASAGIMGAVLTESANVASSAANIRVAVRMRPENQQEMNGNYRLETRGMNGRKSCNHQGVFFRQVVEIIDDKMLIFDPKEDDDGFFFHGKKQTRRDLNRKANRDHKFAFDVVFGPDSTNEDVFEKTTQDLIDVLFAGFNCSGMLKIPCLK